MASGRPQRRDLLGTLRRSPIEMHPGALYISWDDSLPDEPSNAAVQPKPRGWSLVAAGLLLLALVVVVVYTGGAAFSSPLAIVVLAAIGLAAVLLQLRLRKDVSGSVRAPFWLNAAGLVFALASV